MHDVFNVVCVASLNILNIMNWRHDAASWSSLRLSDGASAWAERWGGEYHELFVAATFFYMLADIVFLFVLPQCVKIPGPIVVHHVFAIMAMAVPWYHGTTHGYTLGVFMLADINTMFLILRKLLMRTPKAQLLPQIALPIISTCFYATWVLVRLVLFPIWLFTISGSEWASAWRRTGAPLNLFLVMPLANTFAVYLNFKWTWDLLSGMLRRSSSPAAAPKACPDDLAAPLNPGRAPLRAHEA